MTREEAIQLIGNSGVAEHTEILLRYLNPSVRVTVHDQPPGTNGQVIRSHFGGIPTLPKGTDWPVWENSEYLRAEIVSLEKRIEKTIERTQESPEDARQRAEKLKALLHPKLAEGFESAILKEQEQPEKARNFLERRLTGLRADLATVREELKSGPTPLAFLGQFSLKEAIAVAPLPGLPNQGTLAFFYDAMRKIGGYSPIHRGHCQVLYFPEDCPLIEASFPERLPAEVQFPKRSLSFECEWTLPQYLELETSDGGPELWQTDAYRDLITTLNSNGSKVHVPVHRFGAYPQEIQGDMRLECALVTNGLDCGSRRGYEDPRAAEHEKEVPYWWHLAQFDSDEKMGWMWMDVGRVYFWARQQEILAGDFTKSWAILQSY